MAQSPQFKIYRNGEYVASCKYAWDAAAAMVAIGDEVRHGHGLVVWREGNEEFSAGESYDGAGAIMDKRIMEANIKGLLRNGYTAAQIEQMLAR